MDTYQNNFFLVKDAHNLLSLDFCWQYTPSALANPWRGGRFDKWEKPKDFVLICAQGEEEFKDDNSISVLLHMSWGFQWMWCSSWMQWDVTEWSHSWVFHGWLVLSSVTGHRKTEPQGTTFPLCYIQTAPLSAVLSSGVQLLWSLSWPSVFLCLLFLLQKYVYLKENWSKKKKKKWHKIRNKGS